MHESQDTTQVEHNYSVDVANIYCALSALKIVKEIADQNERNGESFILDSAINTLGESAASLDDFVWSQRRHDSAA